MATLTDLNNKLAEIGSISPAVSGSCRTLQDYLTLQIESFVVPILRNNADYVVQSVASAVSGCSGTLTTSVEEGIINFAGHYDASGTWTFTSPSGHIYDEGSGVMACSGASGGVFTASQVATFKNSFATTAAYENLYNLYLAIIAAFKMTSTDLTTYINSCIIGLNGYYTMSSFLPRPTYLTDVDLTEIADMRLLIDNINGFKATLANGASAIPPSLFWNKWVDESQFAGYELPDYDSWISTLAGSLTYKVNTLKTTSEALNKSTMNAGMQYMFEDTDTAINVVNKKKQIANNIFRDVTIGDDTFLRFKSFITYHGLDIPTFTNTSKLLWVDPNLPVVENMFLKTYDGSGNNFTIYWDTPSGSPLGYNLYYENVQATMGTDKEKVKYQYDISTTSSGAGSGAKTYFTMPIRMTATMTSSASSGDTVINVATGHTFQAGHYFYDLANEKEIKIASVTPTTLVLDTALTTNFASGTYLRTSDFENAIFKIKITQYRESGESMWQYDTLQVDTYEI